MLYIYMVVKINNIYINRLKYIPDIVNALCDLTVVFLNI